MENANHRDTEAQRIRGLGSVGNMPVQNKLPCRLRPTAGSWPRLRRGAGAFDGRVHASVAALRPQSLSRPSGASPSLVLVWNVPPPSTGAPAATVRPGPEGPLRRAAPGRSRFAKARGRRAGQHANEGRQRRCPARRQPGGTPRLGRPASFRLVERGLPPQGQGRAAPLAHARGAPQRDAPERRFPPGAKSELCRSSLIHRPPSSLEKYATPLLSLVPYPHLSPAT
jgi:hypothetical protein